MARPVVSYDDIAAPSSGAGPSMGTGPQMPAPAFASTSRTQGGPPPKKRKRNTNNTNNYNNHHPQTNGYGNNRNNYRGRGGGGTGRKYVQHWDDPGSAAPPMSYGGDEEEEVTTTIVLQEDESYDFEDGEDGEIAEDGVGEAEEEESRELTHDEIWDDSALIEAWESAAAEYEAYHGKGKSWKDKPVKKSPLWYNVPPPPFKAEKPAQQQKTNGTVAAAATTAETETSQPLDFNTFVPQHDASLTLPAAPNGLVSEAQLAEVPSGWPSQDEAFTRAMSAMYWSGYWTAVYHSHQKLGKNTGADEQGEEAVDDGEYAEDADESMAAPAGEGEELVSTQR